MKKSNKVNAAPKLQAIFAIAGLGWANAFYTLSHRQRVMSEGIVKQSFCNVSEAVNCDAVALSDYSAILGFPTAAWGMLYYSIVILLAVWAYFGLQDGDDQKSSRALQLLFLTTAVALVPTLGLASISFVAIKSLCLMCLVSYSLNLLLTFFAWRAKPSPSPSVPESLKSVPRPLWITLAVVSGLHFLAPKMVDNSIGARPIDDAMLAAMVASHLAEPERSIRVAETPALGPAGAPVTIVEYSDMQCPFCARAALTIPQVMQAFPGRVRLVFKNFPLDPACNSNIKGAGHSKACYSAKAARCVYKSKGDEAFFRFTDALFEKQSQIGESLIEQTAAKEGVSKEELAACTNDFGIQQFIMDEVAEGNVIGVKSTPAIFVNGRRAEYGVVPKVLREIIRAHLSQKK